MRFGDSVGVTAPCTECISACNECADRSFIPGGVGLFVFEYVLIVAIISFLITLGFYLVYKHKKDEHSWERAFKRSWPWWIIVFLIPIICFLIVFLIGRFL